MALGSIVRICSHSQVGERPPGCLDPLLQPSMELPPEHHGWLPGNRVLPLHNLLHPQTTYKSTIFPSTWVSLTVNGQRVTANPSAAIWFHINGTNHRHYLQTTKPGWHNDTVWNSIALEGIGQAFKLIPLPKRKNVSKILHVWLNTGKQRQKLQKELQSQCPRCQARNEDQDHILQCKDRRATKIRYNALVLLHSSVTTKSGSSRSWSALHDCMRQWLHSGRNPATIKQENTKQLQS